MSKAIHPLLVELDKFEKVVTAINTHNLSFKTLKENIVIEELDSRNNQKLKMIFNILESRIPTFHNITVKKVPKWNCIIDSWSTIKTAYDTSFGQKAYERRTGMGSTTPVSDNVQLNKILRRIVDSSFDDPNLDVYGKSCKSQCEVILFFLNVIFRESPEMDNVLSVYDVLVKYMSQNSKSESLQSYKSKSLTLFETLKEIQNNMQENITRYFENQRIEPQQTEQPPKQKSWGLPTLPTWQREQMLIKMGTLLDTRHTFEET